MSTEEIIREKLAAALDPLTLTVRNDSDKHIGHAGHDGTGQSHFHVHIVAPRFAGMSRLARHRLIYEILGESVGNQIHALAIGAHAPDELRSQE